VEKKRTSDSENLIACEVAETAPPKNFYTDHLTMMVAKIVTWMLDHQMFHFASSMYNMREKIRFVCNGMSNIVIIWYI
jgi:hypothetical protein